MNQPQQRNIWDELSGRAVPRHWMGAWLTYRKLASLSQLPNSDVRAQLSGLYPMDYVFTFSLKPQQTDDQRSVIMKNWILVAMSCSANKDGVDSPHAPGTSFQAQIYVGKYKQGVALSDRPINGANQFGGKDLANLTGAGGTGMLLRYLKTPLWIPPNTPVLIRVQNLSTNAENNQVEICLQGVGE
jgi:hypothetical protein